MGGSTKTQTTTSSQVRDPYAPTVPALQKIISGASAAYDSGVGSQVYGGQRSAGLGDTTKAGLGLMIDGANAGAGTAAAGNATLNSLLSSGGTTEATQRATAGLAGINPTVDTSGVAGAAARLSDPNSAARTTAASLTGGAFNTDTAPLAGLAGGLASGGTQTQRSLQDVADGKYLGGANPYLDSLIDRSANDAASKVSQQFASSGRYGSGRFSGAVADVVAGIGTQARYQDYEAERGRQASAATAIDAAKNANASTTAGLYSTLSGINQGNAGLATTGANLSLTADQAGLAGQGALASLEGSNADRALGQAGALLSSAQGDRAATLAGVAAQSANQDALERAGRTTIQAGAAQDAARQQALSDAQTVFDEQQAAPWRQAGLASGIVTPIAGLGGTASGTQTTQQKEDPGLLNSILGGVSTGIGLLGKTGAFPTAAARAGSAGWLSSLFALSDERLKENIREVGQTHDGQALYAYNFKGDPTPQIGLLAQEVAKRDPGAVGITPSGFLAVNYDRATAPSAGLASMLARGA